MNGSDGGEREPREDWRPVWNRDRDREEVWDQVWYRVTEGAEGYGMTSDSASVDEFGERRGIEQIGI